MTNAELLEILRADVVRAAPAMLGSTLVSGEMQARIIEVEAYRSDDPACHAFQRRTPRTEVMYGPPGVAYVYFNYGVHWMLNVVAHAEEDPAAILIRAAIPLEGLDQMRRSRPGIRDRDLLSGPGRLTKVYGITSADNGADLLGPNPIGLHLIAPLSPIENVMASPRVGIAEGKWHDVPWRFIDGDALPWVARKPIA